MQNSLVCSARFLYGPPARSLGYRRLLRLHRRHKLRECRWLRAAAGWRRWPADHRQTANDGAARHYQGRFDCGVLAPLLDRSDALVMFRML